jgi:hypothetical protein
VALLKRMPIDWAIEVSLLYGIDLSGLVTAGDDTIYQQLLRVGLSLRLSIESTTGQRDFINSIQLKQPASPDPTSLYQLYTSVLWPHSP